MTISAYEFSSFYADKAYIVPDGLTAIIFESLNGDLLEPTTLDVIPANTGVILYGIADETYELVETESSVEYVNNMLKGTLTDQTIDNDKVHYILGLSASGECGLYWPYGTGTTNGIGAFTNKAGKAYLELDPTSGAKQLRGFILRAPTVATGLVDVDAPQTDDTWFDVLGRPVSQPVQGGLYIREGKKVVMF